MKNEYKSKKLTTNYHLQKVTNSVIKWTAVITEYFKYYSK